MKTEKSILVAFLLNLFFSVFEFFGGIFTGSIAIISDAVHDLGDAASIGVSFFLERKSKKHPDKRHTYGYLRYSVLGSVITTVILLTGSVLVIVHAVERIITPSHIHYDAMIAFAVVGVSVNLAAALLTRRGESLNQKAVNLHMLEDVLGWAVVLIGAIVMRFFDIPILDPILSIGVALFILTEAVRCLCEVGSLFLVKVPKELDPDEIVHHLLEIEGVLDVHHLHLWSMDGRAHYATMHLVVRGDGAAVKQAVRKELSEHGICHATLELEHEGEDCHERDCRVEEHEEGHHHHHHHHHHHG